MHVSHPASDTQQATPERNARHSLGIIGDVETFVNTKQHLFKEVESLLLAILAAVEHLKHDSQMFSRFSSRSWLLLNT